MKIKDLFESGLTMESSVKDMLNVIIEMKNSGVNIEEESKPEKPKTKHVFRDEDDPEHTATVTPTHVHFHNSGYENSFTHDQIKSMLAGKKNVLRSKYEPGFNHDREESKIQGAHVFKNDEVQYHLPHTWEAKAKSLAKNDVKKEHVEVTSPVIEAVVEYINQQKNK